MKYFILTFVLTLIACGVAHANVYKIQCLVGSEWKDWQTSPPAIYLLCENNYTFRATDASDNPVTVTWGGTAGATGISSQTTFLLNTPVGNRTITATDGNTVTNYIFAYAYSVTVVPDDDYQGRSYSRFGIQEYISIEVSLLPIGLTWEIMELLRISKFC